MSFAFRRLATTALTTALLAWAVPITSSAAGAAHHVFIPIRTGHSVLEVVGEVNNFAATPQAPLGTSQQFGYVSNLEGLDSAFTDANPANQNESTAILTFFTNVTTTRVTVLGPFSIVIREGTTTFYRTSAAADFSNPASFQSGEPVLSSTIHQQVIVDTVAKTFTVVNTNAVTSTRPFSVNGDTIVLGEPGDLIRTSLVGVLQVRDGATPPTGHFAGSGMGVSRFEDFR